MQIDKDFMKIKNLMIALCAMLLTFPVDSMAQQASVYGDKFKADVKMNYVYSLDEAMKMAKKKKKLIFFNCFVDWAVPCHGMNQKVFSNQEFCDWMDANFVNLFMNMTTAEGQELAKKYGITSYAHYLVLDADGKVVHRISGGAEVDAFKEKVRLALKPETSLAGATAKIEKGNYTRQDMYNYLCAVDVAGNYPLFKKLAKEFIEPFKLEDFAKKENWIFIYQAVENRQSPCYAYMLENKSLFLKEIPEKEVNNVLEYALFQPIFSYALGDTPFDAEAMEVLGKELQQANLPDTCMTQVYYQVAKMRGERKYLDLIAFLRENKHRLSTTRANLEISLNLPDMNPQERQALVDYLKSSAADYKGGSFELQLMDFIKQLESGDTGIKFEKASFAELLAKAKQENKLVFLDCFTVWCGPCRMMANTVFVDDKVGEFFNTHFVNAKIDMEKGEGIDLAKRYDVTAYPTMLFIDGDGKVVRRVTGAKKADALLSIAAEVLK